MNLRSYVPLAALWIVTVSAACAAGGARVDPPQPTAAPTAPIASAAPTVTAAPTVAPAAPREPCAVLANDERQRVERAATRARAFVRTAVAERRDPRAPARDAVRARLNEARRANDRGSIAALELELLALERMHVAEQFALPADEDGYHPTTIAAEVPCVAHEGAAWGYIVSDGDFVPSSTETWAEPWSYAGIAAVAHVDARDRVRTAPFDLFLTAPTPPEGFAMTVTNPNCCTSFGAAPQSVRLFDYDGDGEPEGIFQASYGIEGSLNARAEVFTVRNDAVVPYPRPAGFEVREVDDVDDDGRPDLLAYEIIDGGARCGSGFPSEGAGPRFAAISLPDGTFDVAGPRARAFVRSYCPRAPVRITSPEDVACARLWGRPVAAIEREVRRRFSAWSCEDVDADRPQRRRNANEEFERMLAYLRIALPFTLP